MHDDRHRCGLCTPCGKRMTASVLDGIPGLGEPRKKRLTKEPSGINAVKRASLDELAALSWLPHRVAIAVHAKIHGYEV